MPDSSFTRTDSNVSTGKRTAKRSEIPESGWIESVYLDLDVTLAELKTDDWLASEVSIESFERPEALVATGIELQYMMEDEWDRGRVARAHREITSRNVDSMPLTSDALDAAADLREQYKQ